MAFLFLKLYGTPRQILTMTLLSIEKDDQPVKLLFRVILYKIKLQLNKGGGHYGDIIIMKCMRSLSSVWSAIVWTVIEGLFKTRGPKGHISCTWVQCATFFTDQPGRKFLFTHRPEKHKLGRRPWDLASCQVSLNSVQWFQRRSRKCFGQSEARVAILFFQSARKTQTW